MTSMTLSTLRVVAMMGALLLTAATVSAQSLDAESLRGIGPVGVLVEQILPEGGVTAATVRSRVELQLRQAGIPLADSTGPTYVYVNVNVLSDGEYRTVFNIDVELRHTVIISTTGHTAFGAETWHRSALSYQPIRDTRTRILEGVDDYVVQFISEYLAVNPPGRTRAASCWAACC